MNSNSTKEEQLEQARAWKAANRERVRAYRKRYYAANKERERAVNRVWCSVNADRLKETKRECDRRLRVKNAEAIKAHRATPEYKELKNARARARYHSDPRHRTEKILRASLTQALRLHGDGRKTRSVSKLIGCTIDEFAHHLEMQFVDGMSWENQGAWHIDHIRPCASFDLSDPEQQRVCFDYRNLQPLWAEDNMRKGSKVA